MEWVVGSSPSTASRKIELHARNGMIKASGSITGPQTFTGYAEYLESPTGKRFRLERLSHLKAIR
ncbi:MULTISPECIES: peptidase G2 autoproteolytic cleavage domain-containing protein [Bacillus]|uniref:peptidase G2 autoproteolytic cleavage domain-containing protein n=1 Tax=Bacillus TaxID=1386 RepID=UPI00263AAF26|nr:MULTISPECIES: peptidase G2 autoproteolytic cleavage domain-containing protein [Bacillus]MDU0069485.1 peptidase G2 autoproteolytic cleavage domain-containing protein [Bacillus sp. IG6]WKB78631.1 peptidase G2 autoproteolytic cleavage domain-containing protein [Bacillus glycinifermentans]